MNQHSQRGTPPGRALEFSARPGFVLSSVLFGSCVPRTDAMYYVLTYYCMRYGATCESAKAISTASVIGAVVDSTTSWPVEGIITTCRCAAGW